MAITSAGRLFDIAKGVFAIVAVAGGFLLGFGVIDQKTYPFSAFFIPFIGVLLLEWAVLERAFVPGRQSVVTKSDGVIYWYVGSIYALLFLIVATMTIFSKL